jgi:predicted ATP-grasp superfamily ATP-dependent carboligase
VTLQQVVMSGSAGAFLSEVNGLLLDGWSIVPGTFGFNSAPGVPDARTPARFVDRNGVTYIQKFFVAVQREELRDPEVARRLIEQAEGRELPELAGVGLKT